MKCPECLTENDPIASFCNSCGHRFLQSRDVAASKTKTYETPIEELNTGSSFAGRYQIIEELGRGGMGRVYKAFDKEIKGKIAIKLIKPDVAGDLSVIERFRNELKLTRDISHKNVCRMYDLSKVGNTYFISMEYVHGEDLKKIMGKIGILSPGQAVNIAKQVCEGLHEAHKLGIIHRDLKPSNIMINSSGTVRIMDFGIAWASKAKGITDSGVIIGTPEYMSPEQVEGKAVDPRSDIYAVGIVLYEVLTGQLPFAGNSALAIGIKKKTEIPQNPRSINPQIPYELDQLIMKCLKNAKEDRPQTAEDLRSELTAIERKIPTAKRIVPLALPKTSGEITVKIRTRKLLFAAAALVALGTILIVFSPLTKKSESPTNPVFSQLTFSQNVYMPEISPDGQAIAFIRSNPRKEDLVVMDIATKQELHLLTASSISQIEWIAEGSELYVRGRNIQGLSSCLISRFGGTPKAVGPSLERLITWAPKGDRYAMLNGYTQVEIRDRDSNLLMTSPPRASLRSVCCIDWNPKVDRLLLANRDEKNAKSLLFSIDLNGANPIELVSQDNPILAAKWTPSGKGILYLVSRGRTKEIWEADVNIETNRLEANPKRLAGGFQGGTSFSVPRQGDKVFITYEAPYWDLWHIHVDSLRVPPSLAPTYLSSSPLPFMRPSLSPDRNQIAFSRREAKASSIILIPTGAGQEKLLISSAYGAANPVWSPDGQQIAFISEREGSQVIQVASVSTGVVSDLSDIKGGGILSLYWLPNQGVLYTRKVNDEKKGLYFAETHKLVNERAEDFSYLPSNFAEPYDFWSDFESRKSPISKIIGRVGVTSDDLSRYLFINDLSYSADGNKIGGRIGAPYKSDEFLVISLAEGTQKTIESDYALVRIMADGSWILARNYDDKLRRDEYYKIRISDGLTQKLATLDYYIAKIPITKVVDGEDEVLVVYNPKSDIWAIEDVHVDLR
jgi:serine/threonine protein kinase